MLQRLIQLRATIRDFTLVTHAVPAPRVRARVPPGLELDTRTGPDGIELAFVSTASFLNKNFRLAYVPYPRASFRQVTYRTYVRRHGEKGVFFFSTWLEKKPAALLERAMMREARLGYFTVRHWDAPGGKRIHEHWIRSGGLETRFLVEFPAAPSRPSGLFASSTELSEFLTERPHGYFKSPLGHLADMVAEHPPIATEPCAFFSGKFGFWESLGILGAGGETPPLAAHYAAEAEFRFRFPARVGPEARAPGEDLRAA